MSSQDPWRLSLDALVACPSRCRIGAGVLRVHWEPAATRDPTRREGAPFLSHASAVDFLVRRVRRIVDGRPEPRVRHRVERLRQHPALTALVLVVGGSHGHPPVYVKWALATHDPAAPTLILISFHATTRPLR